MTGGEIPESSSETRPHIADSEEKKPSPRLKVKFLMAIWGARYIKEFARISLPSYLARGNLPYVASKADLEILVMTSRDSRGVFDSEPAFRALRATCKVRFILIDDLITSGHYGVTLTLAFARGIRDSGHDQTSTHFVFMNSDFVLADGSLKALYAKLEEGHPCVMAPSLRASSEAVLDPLEANVDKQRMSLTMQPREMVSLAMRNLHPTVIAKTVTQGYCTCSTHNQIYWQVDRHTLLARYHLIFMLAIKPERPLRAVNSYCDYGFVPELVPSGRFEILDDSDAFFMLELQSAAQERQFLSAGTTKVTTIARELSSWTTREHRSFAEVDVVFHAEGHPERLAQARADLDRYFGILRQSVSQPPVSHVNHIYWTLGVQAWASTKFGKEQPTWPPELFDEPPEVAGKMETVPAEQPSQVQLRYSPSPTAGVELFERPRTFLNSRYVALLARAKQWQRSMPDVPIWHHKWLDSRLMRLGLRELQGEHRRNLLIASSDSPLTAYLAGNKLYDIDNRSIVDTLDTIGLGPKPEQPEVTGYDGLFLHVHRANMRKARTIIDMVRPRLKRNDKIIIFVEHLNGEYDPGNFSGELGFYADELMPSDWIGYDIDVKFAGGRLKRRLRRVETRLYRYLLPTTARRIPLLLAAVALWPCVAGAQAVNNFLTRNANRECPVYCSSFLVTMKRVPDSSGDR